MLKYLSVKSFAIIEDIAIEFKPNMTVITGETGAGKSLIIDSINLLLGARADSDMVRYQDDKATIYGVFTFQNKHIDELLISYSIPKKDELTIERIIYKTSKNVIKINGVTSSLQLLKQISLYLADIHVQNDTFRLFNKDTYLTFIDPVFDDKFNDLMNEYTLKLNKYNEDLKKYKECSQGKKNTLEKLEYLKFEQQELSELNLEPDLDSKLEEEIAKLSNFDKIKNNLALAYNSLEGECASIDNIYEASMSLSKISSFDTKYNSDYEKLTDCYYILDEIKTNIKHDLDELDFDPNYFDMIQERLNSIEKCMTKYHKSVNELIEYLNKITFEIDMVTNYDELLKECLNNLNDSYKKVCNIALKISDFRKLKAKEIEKALIAECKDLDLENTKFEIEFANVDFNDPLNSAVFLPNGVDSVEFMISLNKGEPLHPLAKTASGGEMSRIMLAFKAYFLKSANLSLVVFDEIDTGVSGHTALEIAKKMHKISKNTQVLCITHLPQVASMGDNHIYIYKQEFNERTTTKIKELANDDRVYHIAMMLSGRTISKFALEHAKELLNEENKKELD